MHLRTALVAASAVVVVAVGSGKPTVDATATPNALPSSPIVDVPSAAPVAPAAVSASRPFSDPLWYPLRRSDMDFWLLKPLRGQFSGLVACVVDNCPAGHGYWAIDFIGDRGDPIFAAGSGIVHVDSRNRDCGTETSGAMGESVWIDHGGGVVTKYRHMDSIAVPNGAFVTPATKIGEMGNKADACEADRGGVNYLHFEVLHNGIHGDRVNPGQLKACKNGRTIRLPQAIGYAGWNQVPYRQIGLPRTDSSCVPGSFATPARPSGVRASIGNEQVAVSWSRPPSGVNAVMIAVADYRPSRGVWSGWTYTRLGGSTSSYTYRKLYNGHPYRFKVTSHGADGYSRWAGTPTVEPAGTPLAPRYNWARVTKTTLEMAWYRSENRGTPVTGYQVAYRQDLGSRWSSWHVTRIDPMGRHTWTDLRSRTRFEVKVRGMSAVGPSSWSQIGSATTKPQG